MGSVRPTCAGAGVCGTWLLACLVAASSAAFAEEREEDLARRIPALLREGQPDLARILDEAAADAWIVVDELCFLAEWEAALACARAVRDRPDTERLLDYVAALREQSYPGHLRQPYLDAAKAVRGEDPDDALAILEGLRLGENFCSLRVLVQRAKAHEFAGRPAESSAAYGEAAELARRLGVLRVLAFALAEGDKQAYRASDFEACLARSEELARLQDRRGSPRERVIARLRVGTAQRRLGRSEEAIATQRHCLNMARDLGDKLVLANCYGSLGSACRSGGRLHEAREAQESALALFEQLGDDEGVIRTLGNLGRIHRDLGNYEEAVACQERSLALARKAGDRRNTYLTLNSLGLLWRVLGDVVRSRACSLEALEMARSARDYGAIAAAQISLAQLQAHLHEYEDAHRRLEEALEAHDHIKHPRGRAVVYRTLSLVQEQRGDLAAALRACETAIRFAEQHGLEHDRDQALVRKASVWLECGHTERALAILAGLRDRFASRPSELLAVDWLVAMGYGRAGRAEEALGIWKRLVHENRRMGRHDGAAIAAANLAQTYAELDRDEEAIDALRDSLATFEARGMQSQCALTHYNLGDLLADSGRVDEARKHLERSRRLAADLGWQQIEAHAKASLAVVELRSGNGDEALRLSREAIPVLAAQSEGLPDEVMAGARAKRGWVYGVGVLAALESDRVADLYEFIEQGHAGALREVLGNRDRLREVLIPSSLRESEAQALSAEALAAGRCRRAYEANDRAAHGAALKELREAQADRLRVRERIELEVKCGAELVSAVVEPLERAQATLGEDVALVLYSLDSARACAVVLERGRARIVRLGTRDAIEEACAAFRIRAVERARGAALREDGTADRDSLTRIEKLLVAPLELAPSIRRVILAPDGPISLMPLAVLLPGREVSYVPSATVLVQLRELADPRGESVLALGDTVPGPPLEGGRPLPLLQNSLAEARAVGDLVLLGDEATEAGFQRALATRPRWRAVHLACHGVVDTKVPLRSALVLSADDETDGYLSVLDILRLRIPADLAVLSACDTGRGRVYRSEGVVGLARAFMLAGVPRVIVSLWKVDDEATRALMERFYALWGEHDAATALRLAQEHVRGQDRWRAPRFWAAWQLWGLPD